MASRRPSPETVARRRVNRALDRLAKLVPTVHHYRRALDDVRLVVSPGDELTRDELVNLVRQSWPSDVLLWREAVVDFAVVEGLIEPPPPPSTRRQGPELLVVRAPEGPRRELRCPRCGEPALFRESHGDYVHKPRAVPRCALSSELRDRLSLAATYSATPTPVASHPASLTPNGATA